MSPNWCHKSTILFILFCKIYSLDLVIISSYLTNTWRNLIFEIIDKHWRFIISDAVSIFSSGDIVASVMTLIPLQRVSCCSWRCHSHHSDASSCYTLRVDILISEAFADLSQSKDSSVCEFSPTELIATSVLILLIPLNSLLMQFIWWPMIAPVSKSKNPITRNITFHLWWVWMFSWM